MCLTKCLFKGSKYRQSLMKNLLKYEPLDLQSFMYVLKIISIHELYFIPAAVPGPSYDSQ